MQKQDNARLREILDRTADLPRERRDAFLETACAGDDKLRGEIESLLNELDRAEGFLDEPTIAAGGLSSRFFQGDGPQMGRTGERIARYKLLQLIGEGGFGSVFMAEQQTPVVRKVALKIIKLGMDSAAIIARFEAERQALAMMDHPNIARVLDAGSTEAGRPYFVMELVQGVPINQYCDRKRLTPRQRIELFVPVCRAVQHAHQKGIIHRDLKPSNILVATYDSQPVPKVIDFGVAKALHQRLTERTLFTQFGNAVGTPEYMSPEQAEMDMLGADTRSDIYSLGVLLYELLTGSTPLDRTRLREAGYAQMLRMIREEEPPKPSTRLTHSGDALASISADRGTDARELARLTAGDLDWIVMKCLEKDRSRRYETADGLARDLERYLRDEPVEASPPSRTYRLRKLVRKHHVALSVSAAFALTLLAATVFSSWQAVRATRSGAAADTAKRVAEAQATEAKAARNSAEAAKKDALESAARATEAQRTAELRLARGRVAEGDAMAQSSRWVEAKELYREAGASFSKLGQSQMPADLGLLNAYLYAPPPLLEFSGHRGKVMQTAFSPDGRLGASAGADGVVCVWDLVGARCKFRLTAHKKEATCVAFSADGRMLASGAYDGSVWLWDLATGKQIRQLQASGAPASGVGFSPHGTWCGVTAPDDWSFIYEVATGRKVGPLAFGGRDARCVAFSPDEKTCLLCGLWGRLMLFETSSGKLLRPTETQFPTVTAVYTPDGRYVLAGASAERDPTLLWDTKTWEIVQYYYGHTDGVGAVAFSTDGTQVISASGDGTVLRWDRLVGSPPTGIGYGDGRALANVSIEPGGALALSGEEDGKVRLWQLSGDRGMHRLNAGAFIRSVAISRDGRLAATAGEDGLRIWDISAHSMLRFVPSVARRLVALSPDGHLALSSDIDGGVHLMDVLTGTETDLRHTPGVTRAAAFSSDGKWMAWADGSTAYVADVATRKIHAPIQPHMTMAESLDFSHDGRVLLSATSHGTAYMWALPSHLELPTLAWLQERRELCGNVVYARRLSIAAAGDNHHRLLVWEPFSGKLLAALDGHRGIIEHVALSPDERWVASGSRDGAVKVWDLDELREARTLLGTGGAIHGLCWSADGRVLLSGANDGNAIPWELDRPAQYRRLLPQLEAAINVLAKDGDNKAALMTLARWYAFRGQDDWAAEIAARADPDATDLSTLFIARSLWHCGQLDAAATRFEEVLRHVSDQDERFYLTLCRDAVARQRLGTEQSRPATRKLP